MLTEGSMWTRATAVGVLSVLLAIYCSLTLVAAQNSTTRFAFPSFPADNGSILTSGDVYFNSLQSSYDLNYNHTGDYCGRMTYKDKVRLKDAASGRVASFSTSFTFSFISYTNTTEHCGEGLVFTFVSNPSISVEEGKRSMCSYGYSPPPQDRVFAVKFGSEPLLDNGLGYVVDPSDGTVGVMVNDQGSLFPILQYNLCGGSPNTSHCTYFCGVKGEFSTWIDYDSPTQTLEVFFRSGTLARGVKPPAATITVPSLYLGDVLDEEMYVAITAKTFWLYFNPEIHRVSSWYFNSTDPRVQGPPPEPTCVTIIEDHKSLRRGLIGGICIFALLWIATGLLLVCVNRKFRNYMRTVENERAQPNLQANREQAQVELHANHGQAVREQATMPRDKRARP